MIKYMTILKDWWQKKKNHKLMKIKENGQEITKKMIAIAMKPMGIIKHVQEVHQKIKIIKVKKANKIMKNKKKNLIH